MATTPIMAVMDLEYADDTVLLARSAEVANKLLRATEREAAQYGLKLNRGKRADSHTTQRKQLPTQTGYPYQGSKR